MGARLGHTFCRDALGSPHQQGHALGFPGRILTAAAPRQLRGRPAQALHNHLQAETAPVGFARFASRIASAEVRDQRESAIAGALFAADSNLGISSQSHFHA
jgi:hypothetical protein